MIKPPPPIPSVGWHDKGPALAVWTTSPPDLPTPWRQCVDDTTCWCECTQTWHMPPPIDNHPSYLIFFLRCFHIIFSFPIPPGFTGGTFGLVGGLDPCTVLDQCLWPERVPPIAWPAVTVDHCSLVSSMYLETNQWEFYLQFHVSISNYILQGVATWTGTGQTGLSGVVTSLLNISDGK